jgi:glutamate/tyrosine decarboxylase-like PLP-dependent enzyme
MIDQQIEKIRELQEEAQKLEPGADARDEMTAKAFGYASTFLESLSEQNAFTQTGKKGIGLLDAPISEHGRSLDEALELLGKEVDSPGLNPASGRHLGYIPGGGLYPSALADYLAAVANRYAGVFFSSPGAVRMENMCLRWICDLIGYGEQAGGNLTSGGSIANLTGLVVARDEAGLKAKEFERAVIYTTRQVHHCVIKAIKFAGLKEAGIRTIAMDDSYRMKPEALQRQIASDKEKGLLPLVIFASAGTTDLGAVDPLEDIAGIAKNNNIWFHVDAAYGGFFLLTDYGQEKLRGIDQADSVTIDPHKGLFLPYGTGALLVKDVQQLYNSQHMTANYLQDTLSARDELSPADLSPELSKHFRGLRMWLPLQLFGVAPFRAALQEKLELCRYFYHKVKEIPGMEVGPEPELSVMFFRYLPNDGDANAFNKELVDALHRDGRIFLSSTNIEGTVFIRLAVLSFRTHLKDMDLTLRILKEKIGTLQND